MEEAVEPEIEIVDPHHHMWDTETKYGRYELDDLRIDTGSGHNVVETVFIDCGASYLTEGPEHLRPVGETRYIAGRADESDRTPGPPISAIVSRADLTLGTAVTEVLDAHVAAAGGRFRGIRHSGAWASPDVVQTARSEPPPQLYRRDDFREGARALAAAGLSYEAWQYHYQIGDVIDLAENVPELTIILNHIGGPLGLGEYAGKREQVLDGLKQDLVELATFNNVMIKVGGIGMSRYGVGWEKRDRPPGSEEVLDVWGDMLRFCIDTFGPERSMFESNYPVDGETTSYVVLWNAFKKLTASDAATDRANLFAGTARRAYKLSPRPRN